MVLDILGFETAGGRADMSRQRVEHGAVCQECAAGMMLMNQNMFGRSVCGLIQLMSRSRPLTNSPLT